MILNNGYDVSGAPHSMEYSKNPNGYYTVKIADYNITDRNGRSFKALLIIPNAKGPFDGDKGVIDLSSLDPVTSLSVVAEETNDTLWQMVIPEGAKDTFDKE